MIKGQEFHSIIGNIFDDVRGIDISEQLQINCPKCQEREGLSYPDGKYNLEINSGKRIFRCWKCDEPKFSGSLGKLIYLYGSNIDRELYKSYSKSYFNEYNINNDEDVFIEIKLPDEMILFSEMNINNSDHFEAYNYMVVDRKFNKDVLYKYKIGFCVTGDYAKRIIIPSYNNTSDLTYFVSRSYDKKVYPKYKNPKLNRDIIFNEGFINWDSTIYIVEGVFEMLSFPVNSVVLLGKLLSPTLVKALKKYKPNVVILLDPDAMKNAVDILFTLINIYGDDEDKIKIVNMGGKLDFDEIRIKHGRSKMIEVLRNARKLTIEDHFINKKFNEYNRKNY